jgi:hypothetical protein
MAAANGGSFKDGFIGGAIGFGVGLAFGPAGVAIRGTAADSIAARTAIAAVGGGVGSKLAGGSFADGAYSAAFFHLFNSELTFEKEEFDGLWVISETDLSEPDGLRFGDNYQGFTSYYDFASGKTIVTHQWQHHGSTYSAAPWEFFLGGSAAMAGGRSVVAPGFRDLGINMAGYSHVTGRVYYDRGMIRLTAEFRNESWRLTLRKTAYHEGFHRAVAPINAGIRSLFGMEKTPYHTFKSWRYVEEAFADAWGWVGGTLR